MNQLFGLAAGKRAKRQWRKMASRMGWAAAVFVIALLAYLRWGQGMVWADWTGFGASGGGPGKTLWDWLELLIIPTVLGAGALWLERSERVSDRRIARERWEHEQNLAAERRENDLKMAAERREDDRRIFEDQQRDAALQAFIDKMTDLLLDKTNPLRESQEGDEVRVVARTRTLATLRNLDPLRKGMLIKFLSEAKLITTYTYLMNHRLHEPARAEKAAVIHLTEADLREADLEFIILNGAELGYSNLAKATILEVDLSEANLRGANLSGAKIRARLTRARLVSANLQGADLTGSDLSGADLSAADLSGANLAGANLRFANLVHARLTGADLSGCFLNDANLSWADLSGAILSDADLTNAEVTDQQIAAAVMENQSD